MLTEKMVKLNQALNDLGKVNLMICKNHKDPKCMGQLVIKEKEILSLITEINSDEVKPNLLKVN